MTGVAEPMGLAGVATGMVGVDVGSSTRREKSRPDYAHDEINDAKLLQILSFHCTNKTVHYTFHSNHPNTRIHLRLHTATERVPSSYYKVTMSTLTEGNSDCVLH